MLDELKSSLTHDNDDDIFAVTENSGHVAMVLIEKTGHVSINAQAREKLKTLWPTTYERHMQQLIPVLAKQLHEGALPINGVKQGGVWRRREHQPFSCMVSRCAFPVAIGMGVSGSQEGVSVVHWRRRRHRRQRD